MLTEKQQQFKDEWLKALRSGEFTQIKGQLGDNDKGRCCLGVGCDVAMNLGYEMTADFDGVYRNYMAKSVAFEDWCHAFMPVKFINDYDLPFDNSGAFHHSDITFAADTDEYRGDGAEYHMEALSELNDSEPPLTFDQIADIIDWMWV